MLSRPTVLFICTGNIFRSMTAEFALKASLGANAPFDVRSAGLLAAPHEVVAFVSDYLAARGHDTARHRPTRLNTATLDGADLAVAMGTEHRARIAQDFDRCLPLFSEIAYGTVEALRDVDEVVPDWRRNKAAAAAYGRSLMDYIFDGMPGFLGRMDDFMAARRPKA